MLTLFAIPKPFLGHSGVIQHNALESWAHLQPRCQLLVLGDDEGVAEAARIHGAVHLPVATNELGTPILSDAFRRAREHAKFPVLAYANADILFTSSLVDVALEVAKRFDRFLLTGRRHDVDVRSRLDFSEGWEDRLAALAAGGVLSPANAIDWFAFPRAEFSELPEFTVGRAGWDNWMIYRAWSLPIPLVEATPRVLAVHQRHDYGHVPKARGRAWEGPESDANRTLAKASNTRFEPGFFTLALSDWQVAADGIERRRGLAPALLRVWVRLSSLPLVGRAVFFLHRLRGLARRFREQR